MKRKSLGFSLLLLTVLVVSGLCYHLLFNRQNSSRQAPVTAQVAKQDIIINAPAIVDALNDVTRVPTLQSGIIKKIHVAVGQMVKKDQPLLSLDKVPAINNLKIQRIYFKQAKTNLLIQEKSLEHIEHLLKSLRSIDKRAISQMELKQKMYEANMGRINLKQAQYNLKLALASLKNAELTLSQYTTVAPKDGIVLQISGHEEELVGGGQILILLGDAEKIIVRVSIDERDTYDYNPNSSAYLTSNENAELKIPLTFIQLDRFIITQERLNSRVQEVLYYFKRDAYPNLVSGKQFDAHVTVKTTT
jgi:macrolide-specific efflux system membrane fusion protein